MSPGLRDLKDKLVLVTGAATGIGLETARAFARMGARIVLSDIDAPRLREARETIASAGADCVAYPADVACEASMKALAEAVLRTHGAPDVLVNNAGIGYLGNFWRSPLDGWRRVLDINVMGVVHGCWFFLPAMIAAGGARRVVNLASLAGIAPAPNMSAYAASKHAVIGLSDTLAMELDATAVGVTTVCPGIIDTAIVQQRGNVSAAVSDGQLARLQAYYRAHGATPAVVAAAIVDGVRAGRSLVLVGPWARPMYHIKRLSRGLTRRLTLSAARKSGYL